MLMTMGHPFLDVNAWFSCFCYAQEDAGSHFCMYFLRILPAFTSFVFFLALLLAITSCAYFGARSSCEYFLRVTHRLHSCP
jgi:hypothetical protein